MGQRGHWEAHLGLNSQAPTGPDVNAKRTTSCWGGPFPNKCRPLPGARSLWHQPPRVHVCTRTHTLQEGPRGTHQPSPSGPPCRAACRLAKQTPLPLAMPVGLEVGSAQGVPTCAQCSFAPCGLAHDHHATPHPQDSHSQAGSVTIAGKVCLCPGPSWGPPAGGRGGVPSQAGELGAQPSSRLSITAGPSACSPVTTAGPSRSALPGAPSPHGPLASVPHSGSVHAHPCCHICPQHGGRCPGSCPCPHGRPQTLRASARSAE